MTVVTDRLRCPEGHEYPIEEAAWGPCCPTPDPVEEMNDSIAECDHADAEVAETGPRSFSGATELYLACECGWSEYVGPGGGVL